MKPVVAILRQPFGWHCPAGCGTQVLLVLQVLPGLGLSLGGLPCNETWVFLFQPTAFSSSCEVWGLVLAEFKGGGVQRCFYSAFVPLHVLGWLGSCLDLNLDMIPRFLLIYMKHMFFQGIIRETGATALLSICSFLGCHCILKLSVH